MPLGRSACTSAAAWTQTCVGGRWAAASWVPATPAASSVVPLTCAMEPLQSSSLWRWLSVLPSCPLCGACGRCSFTKSDSALVPKLNWILHWLSYHIIHLNQKTFSLWIEEIIFIKSTKHPNLNNQNKSLNTFLSCVIIIINTEIYFVYFLWPQGISHFAVTFLTIFYYYLSNFI